MKSRYKPVGWRREPYRHYLAARGIRTKKYFVRDELKGNRESGPLKAAYAQGWTKAQLRANPKVRKAFDISAEDVLPERSQRKFPGITEDRSIAEGDVPSEPLEPEPVPEDRPLPEPPELEPISTGSEGIGTGDIGTGGIGTGGVGASGVGTGGTGGTSQTAGVGAGEADGNGNGGVMAAGGADLVADGTGVSEEPPPIEASDRKVNGFDTEGVSTPGVPEYRGGFDEL